MTLWGAQTEPIFVAEFCLPHFELIRTVRALYNSVCRLETPMSAEACHPSKIEFRGLWRQQPHVAPQPPTRLGRQSAVAAPPPAGCRCGRRAPLGIGATARPSDLRTPAQDAAPMPCGRTILVAVDGSEVRTVLPGLNAHCLKPAV